MNNAKTLKIILILLVVLIAHNFYLNYEILQIKDDAQRARRNSSYAEDYARDAANYASDAADYAREASEYAEDASLAAFANNCGWCPN